MAGVGRFGAASRSPVSKVWGLEDSTPATHSFEDQCREFPITTLAVRPAKAGRHGVTLGLCHWM